MKQIEHNFPCIHALRGIVRNVFGVGILLLFLLPLDANAEGANAATLLWDWSFVGDDGSVQQGTFVTMEGDINDPNTIYTATEFWVTRSDAGHLSVGAPIGSTTDGTYHAFGDAPVKFRVVNNQFIFGPGGGDLGGRYDTAYDSPNGYHVFLFANLPGQPSTGVGYLYYNPPGVPYQCCNVGGVSTSGSKIQFSAFSVNVLKIGQQHGNLFVLSNFALGNDNNGIDPMDESVTLKVGNFTMTIPAGSFHRKHFGLFTFIGQIDNVKIEALIMPLGSNRFGFQAAAYGAALSGIKTPVTVELIIGNDSGITSVKAIIHDDEIHDQR